MTVEPDARAPVANFTLSRESGPAPLYVKFTDCLTGSPSSRRRDFGDLAWSTATNLSVVFWQAGNHAVTLTVRNPYGSTSVTKNLSVTALPGQARSIAGAPVAIVG